MAERRPFIEKLSRAWILACCGSLLLMHSTGGAAAEDAPQTIRLRHEPPQTKQLPPAGTLVPISVQLENSSDVDIKIRLVGSRDGRFMDIAFSFGVLNASDRPTYTIQIPSPTSAMTYQFIAHQPGGELTLTDKFVVKRNCVPGLPTTADHEPNSTEYKQEVATLVAQARALEGDNRNLETALKLIEDLRRDIPE
jgi:hypothetical protein